MEDRKFKLFLYDNFWPKNESELGKVNIFQFKINNSIIKKDILIQNFINCSKILIIIITRNIIQRLIQHNLT